MLQLVKSQIRLEETSKILRAKDYLIAAEAEEIINTAKAEAEQIRKEAEEEFKARKEQGYQEGLQKGKAEIAERMIEHMSRSAAYFSKFEKVLIDLVIKASKKLLGEFDRNEVVERVVRRVLETTRNEGHVTVRVPPAQSDYLKSRVSTIMASFPKVEFLEVVPDKRLKGDGCILETDVGIVDASLETQLKALETAMVNSMK
jgi:type III secretion protein L